MEGFVFRVRRMWGGNGCLLLFVFLAIVFLSSIGLATFSSNLLKQAHHGVGTGYMKGICVAQGTGKAKKHCISKGCTFSIECCDFPVLVFPELVRNRGIASLLDGGKSFESVLEQRACKANDPCAAYRKILNSDKDGNATRFRCRFSAEKLKSPPAALDFCPRRNIDADYFGSCAVVTEPEFKLLISTDKDRQRNKPALQALLAAGIGGAALACACALVAVCLDRRHRAAPAGNQAQAGVRSGRPRPEQKLD